jgi:hypothetical protein
MLQKVGFSSQYLLKLINIYSAWHMPLTTYMYPERGDRGKYLEFSIQERQDGLVDFGLTHARH